MQKKRAKVDRKPITDNVKCALVALEAARDGTQCDLHPRDPFAAHYGEGYHRQYYLQCAELQLKRAIFKVRKLRSAAELAVEIIK